MFKISRYFELQYWTKKIVGDVDVQSKMSDTVPVIKQKFREFVAFCTQSKEKLKDIPGTNYDLGLQHMQWGNTADAIMRFRMVCYLTPENINAHYFLGRCLAMAGEDDKARKEFMTVLARDPQYDGVKYQIAKLDAPESITRLPVSTIKERCQMQANYFEDDYLAAGYEGHALLVQALLEQVTDKNPNLEVLDLGCGTGLCGLILKEKEVTKSIVGVDIVQDMLAKAADCQVGSQKAYDALTEAEITQYLAQNTRKYDALIADVAFDYTGDLGPVMPLFTNALKSGGYLAFILRTADQPDEGFRFNPDFEDFTYSDPYIIGLLQTNSYTILKKQAFDMTETEAGVIFVCRHNT